MSTAPWATPCRAPSTSWLWPMRRPCTGSRISNWPLVTIRPSRYNARSCGGNWMLKLEDIKPDAQVRGIKPDEVVRVVAVVPVGNDALTVYFKDSQGSVQEQMLFRDSEPHLSLAQAGRPWAFDAPGAEFKLGLEAYR